MIQVQILIGDLERGHLESPEVTNRLLLITHDWKELEQKSKRKEQGRRHEVLNKRDGFRCVKTTYLQIWYFSQISVTLFWTRKKI